MPGDLLCLAQNGTAWSLVTVATDPGAYRQTFAMPGQAAVRCVRTYVLLVLKSSVPGRRGLLRRSYDTRIRGSGLGKAGPMSVDLKNAFRLSFVTGETALPIPPVSEILARLRSGPVWDGASIARADDEFPLLHVEWHEGHA
jgi:hypothetical protein